MKFCTFKNHNGEVKLGVVDSNNSIHELENYKNMKELIIRYKDDMVKIQEVAAKSKNIYSNDRIRFLAPVTDPDKMIFVGLNYRDHARETNSSLPEYPVLFAKFRNSLIGSGEDVIIPYETKKCDYEGELAFIIGNTAKNVEVENAMKYVFGYTICNDVSARDLQSQTSQWLRGKAVDTFAPMGPVLVTADEIENPHNLKLFCRVNGVERQKSNTKEMIFNIPYLISYLSRTITLEPGDIVSTGTPSGVIIGMKDQIWLEDGDVCEVEIEKIGILKNCFKHMDTYE
jgi:2-keto-4-pentenoate hydratase/2-oxohepta-3-ene-1,7-dioic acid hydratase in catechol pathway